MPFSPDQPGVVQTGSFQPIGNPLRAPMNIVRPSRVRTDTRDTEKLFQLVKATLMCRVHNNILPRH